MAKKSKKKKTSKKVKTKVVTPEVVTTMPVIKSKGELTSSDPLTQYLAQIRSFPVLDRDEEKRIATEYISTKDPQLAEILVTSNLRFVVKVAMEYAKFGAKLIDLIQEGNLGLMHAVKDYQPDKGVRLISYAVWWIRGYIQEYLMKQYSLVKIGTTQNQRKLFYQLKKQQKELEQLGFGEQVKLISQKMNIPEKEIEDMSKRMSGKDISLDQTLNDDDQSTLLDLQTSPYEASPESQVEKLELLSQLTTHIEKIKNTLNEKELFILDQRMLAEKPLTLQEIGNKYGTTREAVRQAESRLFKKIQNYIIEHMGSIKKDFKDVD